MPSSSTARTGFQTIESFRLSLDDFGQVLEAESPSKWLEAQLLVRLASPVRLLRWAVVKVEPLNAENQTVETSAFAPVDVDALKLELELAMGQENPDVELEEKPDEKFEAQIKKLETNGAPATARRFWCEGAYLRRHVSLS